VGVHGYHPAASRRPAVTFPRALHYACRPDVLNRPARTRRARRADADRPAGPVLREPGGAAVEQCRRGAGAGSRRAGAPRPGCQRPAVERGARRGRRLPARGSRASRSARRRETCSRDRPRPRAWARTVSADLQPLTRDTLPEIPGAEVEPRRTNARPSKAHPRQPRPVLGSPSRQRPVPRPPSRQGPVPRPTSRRPHRRANARRLRKSRPAAGEPVRQPGWAPDRGRTPPIRRLGGLALIIAVGAAVVAAVVLLVTIERLEQARRRRRHCARRRQVRRRRAVPAEPGRPVAALPKVHVVATIPLAAADGSAARGAAEIVQEQGSGARALLVAGSGLKPSGKSSAYAVWLYNSATDALSLGFFAQQVGTNGQLEGTAPLPRERVQLPLDRDHARDARGATPPRHGSSCAARSTRSNSTRRRAPAPGLGLLKRRGPASSLPGFMIEAGSSVSLTARNVSSPSRAGLPPRAMEGDRARRRDGGDRRPSGDDRVARPPPSRRATARARHRPAGVR